MLRKNLIIAFLILISSIAFGQGEKRLNEAMAKLKSQGVDTFIVFNTITLEFSNETGYLPADDNDIFYLYWIYKKSASVTRIENNYEYLPIVNLQSEFVKLFTTNLKKVDKELIMPYTYTKLKESGKKGKERVNVIKDRASSPNVYPSIRYITPTDTLVRMYNTFDLQSTAPNTLPNDCSKHNNGTLIAKLVDIARKETQGYVFVLKEQQ
jgi:hypothetical protein